ncbi:MAG: ribbon-helix-helix protein, CopG family [Candidatus Thorarchaeota archaeon]|nr:ribbon-helix-helix protein, CopG family [Candidatus Thorarchaeota archaeon]
MRVVTICLPESYVDGMDKLIEREMYPNRSEVIRIAIRDLLVSELWGERKQSKSASLVAQLERPMEQLQAMRAYQKQELRPS